MEEEGRGGRREENEKERGEEEKEEEEEERGEEKETEPETRRKQREEEREAERACFWRCVSPPLSQVLKGLCALRGAALSRRSWELGGIVRSSPVAAASGAGLERAGLPPSAAPGAPSPVAPLLRLALPGVAPGEAGSTGSLLPRAPLSAPRAHRPRPGPGRAPSPLSPSARGGPARFRPPWAARPAPAARPPVAPASGSGRVPGLCLLVLLVHARAAQHSKAVQGKEGGDAAAGPPGFQGPRAGARDFRGARQLGRVLPSGPGTVHPAPSSAGALTSGHYAPGERLQETAQGMDE